MAYQQPTVFFSKPTELTSEDYLNGIRTQDAAETYRRKRALADAFSKSITTKPVIADADEYNNNGNLVRRKGDVIARPGDVDQQKFFEHSARAGLGFDEAKAVYDHYDMQKKAALSALKTGNEIDALDGGTGVEGRAGAPVFRGQAAQQHGTTGQGGQAQPEPEAPAPVDELAGLSDEKKIDKLTKWMNSKKKNLVAKAQSIIGATVDGVSGKKTRMAMSDFKDALIKSNLRKDVTQGAQNRVDVISTTPNKGEDGKLALGDEFDSTFTPRKIVDDTRTSLQVIEDRGATNGASSYDIGYKNGSVKVRGLGAFPKTLRDTLSQQGITPEQMQDALDLKLSSVSVPTIYKDGQIDVLGFKQRKNDYEAKLKEAESEFYKELASGNAATVGRQIASAANNRAETEFKQARTISKGLGDYGIKDLAPADAADAAKALKQFKLAKSIEESTTKLIKNSSKLTPDELSNAVKQPLMMMAQIEGAGNEKQEEGLMAGLRQDKGIAAILDKNAGKNWKEQINIVAISKLTSQSQAKFLRLLNDYAKDIVRNGKARNDLDTYAKLTGGKFDTNAGEGSGARKQLEDKAKKAKSPTSDRKESREERMKRLGL